LEDTISLKKSSVIGILYKKIVVKKKKWLAMFWHPPLALISNNLWCWSLIWYQFSLLGTSLKSGNLFKAG